MLLETKQGTRESIFELREVAVRAVRGLRDRDTVVRRVASP